MLRFFGKSAILIFVVLSIEPASAQMWRRANFHPFSLQHQAFRSMTFSPNRLAGQRYVSAPSMRNLRLSNPSQQARVGQKTYLRSKNFEQAPASPYGTSGNLPQNASYSAQGVNGPPQGTGYSLQGAAGARQGASYAPQGGSYDQPEAQSGPRRLVSHCILSGGVTCPTLSSPGSYCECRDNFGRHFRGVAQ
jgi:hypothetical protein